MKRTDIGKGLLDLTNSESDEAAWTAIAEQYRRLLIVCAVRYTATAASGESAEVIADQALTRAWLALSSKGLGSFPNPAAFLSYLRMCVTQVAIDAARARATQTRISQSLAASEATSAEQHIIEESERIKLWQLINGLMKTEEERVALVERFVLDLPPRIIQARHPALFADTTAVYRAVRTICDRLRRHSVNSSLEMALALFW